MAHGDNVCVLEIAVVVIFKGDTGEGQCNTCSIASART